MVQYKYQKVQKRNPLAYEYEKYLYVRVYDIVD